MKRMDNELCVDYTRNGAKFSRRFPFFGIPSSVSHKTGVYCEAKPEGIAGLHLDGDCVSCISVSPCGSCGIRLQWNFLQNAVEPVSTEIGLGADGKGVLVEGCVSCQWNLFKGENVLILHTAAESRDGLDVFLHSQGAFRRLFSTTADGAGRGISYEDDGIYEGRMEVHVATTASDGSVEEVDYLLPLLPELPILGRQY